MKFFKNLTLKRVIIFLIVLFVLYLAIDFLANPKDFIDGVKDAYREGYNAATSK